MSTSTLTQLLNYDCVLVLSCPNIWRSFDPFVCLDLHSPFGTPCVPYLFSRIWGTEMHGDLILSPGQDPSLSSRIWGRHDD